MKPSRRPPKALRAFLAPYDPAISRLLFAARTAVLDAAPEANELIYDAYNAVSCVYSFTGRQKEAFCHVAAYARYVNLGFNRGAQLPDPQGMLVGAGASIRHVRISAVDDLKQSAVRKLIRAAVSQGRTLSPTTPEEGQSVVKAVSDRKRRPR